MLNRAYESPQPDLPPLSVIQIFGKREKRASVSAKDVVKILGWIATTRKNLLDLLSFPSPVGSYAHSA